MQIPQRNIAKLARRRVLVVITARTRGSGKGVVQCYAVSLTSCLLGAGLQISDRFLFWSPFGCCCPRPQVRPLGGAVAVAAVVILRLCSRRIGFAHVGAVDIGSSRRYILFRIANSIFMFLDRLLALLCPFVLRTSSQAHHSDLGCQCA